jgi:hypothetical protein
MLESTTVVSAGFEEFVQVTGQKLARLAAAKSKPSPPASQAGGSHEFVFIDTAPETLPLAREIGVFLRQHGVSSGLPLLDAGSPAEARQDLEGNLRDCDAAIILLNSNTSWAREQLRFCLRVLARRDQPLRVVGLLHRETPPPMLNMDFASLRVEWLPCPTPQAAGCLDRFMSTLRAG